MGEVLVHTILELNRHRLVGALHKKPGADPWLVSSFVAGENRKPWKRESWFSANSADRRARTRTMWWLLTGPASFWLLEDELGRRFQLLMSE